MQDVAKTPVADTIELANMTVEDSYDGPHLQGKPCLHMQCALGTTQRTMWRSSSSLNWHVLSMLSSGSHGRVNVSLAVNVTWQLYSMEYGTQ